MLDNHNNFLHSITSLQEIRTEFHDNKEKYFEYGNIYSAFSGWAQTDKDGNTLINYCFNFPHSKIQTNMKTVVFIITLKALYNSFLAALSVSNTTMYASKCLKTRLFLNKKEKWCVYPFLGTVKNICFLRWGLKTFDHILNGRGMLCFHRWHRIYMV